MTGKVSQEVLQFGKTNLEYFDIDFAPNATPSLNLKVPVLQTSVVSQAVKLNKEQKISSV